MDEFPAVAIAFTAEQWEALQSPATRAAVLRLVPEVVEIGFPADLGNGVLVVEDSRLSGEDCELLLWLLDNPEELDALAEEAP